jgi:hypothetical protein
MSYSTLSLQKYNSSNTPHPLVVGRSSSYPAASATILQSVGITTNANYWITIGGVATQCYVNFTLPGGPYILVMTTASTGSTYGYDSSVWTNPTGGISTALDATTDVNQVHTAFYTLPTTRTGLALYQNSSSYFHYIDHNSFTAQKLSIGYNGTLISATPDNTSIASGSLISNGQTSRAQGWVNAITAAGYSAINNGLTYYRHGWQHGIPDPTGYGYCRFGWTADQDSSDSRDRAIGIGLKNGGSGGVGSFTPSAGYFDNNTSTKNNLRAWLYIKN